MCSLEYCIGNCIGKPTQARDRSGFWWKYFLKGQLSLLNLTFLFIARVTWLVEMTADAGG